VIQSVNIIGSVLFLLFLSVIIYGIVKRKKEFFLFGICLYNTIPIIGESIAYGVDGELIHLSNIMAFLILIILCLPTKAAFDANNQAAVALSKKIGCVIIATNLYIGYLILNEDLDVTPKFGFFHFVIASIITYVIIRISSQKNMFWS
jgi:hypothetical protein